jgi:hypothetical protein
VRIQLLGVRLLKCVGYDEAFQREVHEKSKSWVPPPPSESKGKRRKSKSKGRATANRRDQTPMQADEDVTDSEHNQFSETDNEEEERDDVVYVQKGTKSRPIF